jgi:hypothetical protein
MPEVSFDFSEVITLTGDLRRVAKKVPGRTSQAVRKTAFDIQRDAKIFAPVDTGFLRSSITVTTSHG